MKKLSQKTRQEILALQNEYPVARSALIPSLHIAQKEQGYLPTEIQKEVAELFNIELSEVQAVVSFYDMFHEHPVGKQLIHVCKNLSCMLRGSDSLLATLCRKLNILPGQTTTDGNYTLQCSECLGACDKAPLITIDETLIGPIEDLNQIDQILASHKGDSSHG